MNVYLLDAIIASSILFAAIAAAFYIRASAPPRLRAPEGELANLLSHPGFVAAVYRHDTRALEAYVNGELDEPYNLTLWDLNGTKILSVGAPVEGVAAVAELPGWNGTFRPLIVSLRVGGG